MRDGVFAWLRLTYKRLKLVPAESLTPHPAPAHTGDLAQNERFAWLRLTEHVSKSDMVAHRTRHLIRLADTFGFDRSQAPLPIPVEPHPARFPYLLWRFLPRLQAHGRNWANRDELARSSSPLTCGDAKRHIPLRPFCARFPYLLGHILPRNPGAGGKGRKGYRILTEIGLRGSGACRNRPNRDGPSAEIGLSGTSMSSGNGKAAGARLTDTGMAYLARCPSWGAGRFFRHHTVLFAG